MGAGGWHGIRSVGRNVVRWAGGAARPDGRPRHERTEGLLSMVGLWRQHRWSTGAVIPYVRMRGCGGALVCQPTLIRHKLHESRRRRGDVEGEPGRLPLVHSPSQWAMGSCALLLLCSFELGLGLT